MPDLLFLELKSSTKHAGNMSLLFSCGQNLKSSSNHDRHHFDREGQRILGGRYYDAFKSL